MIYNPLISVRSKISFFYFFFKISNFSLISDCFNLTLLKITFGISSLEHVSLVLYIMRFWYHFRLFL